ncbi:MAG: ACP phosphodiesterase [Ferruginibacter sp.]
MISDFVKGKKQYDYDAIIQKGIRLHREIDSFTDEHPITKEMKSVFKPFYGLYAGAFADIVYDHFLANDETYFENPSALEAFTLKTYQQLDMQITITPPIFQQMFPSMKNYNWLFNYRNETGIEKSFEGMVKRAKYMNDPSPAYKIFLSNKRKMQMLYDQFFPLLKNHAASALQQLLNVD